MSSAGDADLTEVTTEPSRSTVHTVWAGEIATLTVSRPPANAFDDRTIAALADQAEAVAARRPRGLLITAVGDRFFSPGGDIKELATLDLEGGLRRVDGFNRLLKVIGELSCPVAIAANGTAVGGGMELLVVADFVTGVAGARFGMPEINHGLLPSAASVANTIRRLGRSVARDVLLSGRLFDADEAAAIGLLDLVGPSAPIAREWARAWLEELAAKPRILVESMLEALRVDPDVKHDTVMELTRSQFVGYFTDPEATAARERLLTRWRR